MAVYGGAGVGKTTTLVKYAGLKAGDSRFPVVYVPLNRVVKKLGKDVFDVTNFNKSDIDRDLISKMVLVSRSLDVNQENICMVRDIFSSGVCLVLDGIDEVYNSIPGLIDSISSLKKEFSDVQLVVSSRDCVSYLKEIDFLGVTLLPFTKPQLNRFIRGWLEADEANRLIASVESRGLYEYIKTPLLATITCSLVRKGVDASSTENEIYSQRVRLLTEEYDLHKGVSRQVQSGSMLRLVARKIAFLMHRKGHRLFSKELALVELKDHMAGSYSDDLLIKCLDELIDPCNVILFDQVSGEYSFGHFRFQEHLAAEELATNRSVDLINLVGRDWWVGALCLYTQNHPMFDLIEDIYLKSTEIRYFETTLRAMIENRPKHERYGLTELLEQYLKSDVMDRTLIDSSYDDYDYNF